MLRKLTAMRITLAALLFFVSMVAFAQQKTVTGRVTGEDGKPVVGATITVKGTNVSTQANEEGAFTLSVPANASRLVISSVGFEGQEVAIGTSGDLTISMRATTSTLNEVVVTGYSSQAKKDITGSVSVVKTEDLKSMPAANAEQQLQGRVAGVTVTSSPVPGQGAQVRIRGFGSFRNNEPLYVIDGVQTNSLAGVNPNDIEAMSVLKDAAAASIYGARASSGVVVVTTKKGKQGAAKVSYSTYYGRQDPGKGFTNLLNPQEMADLVWKAYQNSGQTPPASQYGSGSKPVLPDYILAGATGGLMEGDSRVNPSNYRLDRNDPANAYLIVRANKAGTNWFDEITRVAPIKNHNIALSGGANKSRYLFSLDYFDQDAITVFNYFKRYTGRLNTEFNVKNNLRIGQNLQIAYSQGNTPANNNEGTPIAMSYRMQPIIPVYDIAGNFAGSRGPNLGNASNPYANLFRAKDNLGQNLNILGNFYAEVDFLKYFTARSSFGGQMGNGNYYFYTFRTYENAENNTGNAYVEGSNRFRSSIWTNQLTFKKTFGTDHDVTALAGSEAVEDVSRFMETAVAGLFSDDPSFRSISTGNTVTRAVGSPATPTTLFSLYGKVDYAFRDKYLASFTVRRDGSSRFGPEFRYGVFPAGSLGWRISREKFMEGINWLSDLKLRASYGTMGNQQPVAPANQFTTFGQGPGASFYDITGSSSSLTPGFIANFTGNPLGRWEKNTTANGGFDASLFGGKTEVAFDYYVKQTGDLLFRLQQPALGGAPGYVNPASFNVASMRNSGIDLMVLQKARVGKGSNQVNLDGTFTFTTYNNKITGLAPGIDFFETGTGARNGNYIRNAVGHPVSAFFGYKVVGLFQNADDVTKSPAQASAAPGRFKYADVNGDNQITAADRTFIGDPNPDFTYGLNLNASFKQFDMSIFFYGAQGRELINYTRYWTDFFPSFQGAKSKDLLYNSWTPQNTGARVPIAENNSNFSNNAVANSYYIEDGSYLRLKNLSFGYNLSPRLLSKFKIDRLRLYVQGTNLLTFTKYTGLDPEVPFTSESGFGFDAGSYPNVKQFLFGVNLNF